MGKKIAYKANREGVAERFVDTAVQKSIEVDLALIDHYDKLLSDIELYIVNTAKQHDVNAFYRLRSVPGIGKIRPWSFSTRSRISVVSRACRILCPTAVW